MVSLNPYINFNGNAREAGEFYQQVFDGSLELNTYEQGGMAEQYPDKAEKIMHGMVSTDKGLKLMISDAPDPSNPTVSNISVSLSGFADDETDLKKFWDKLSEGATVAVPLEKAPWGDTFGMLTDKFGVNWMVNISGAQA